MSSGVMVVVDPSLIEQIQGRLLLSEKGMARHLGIDFRTYVKVRDGKAVRSDTARTVMENLGLRHIKDVLAPESLAEVGKACAGLPTTVRGELPSDWVILDATGEPTELANGLRFQAWRLCQRHISERLARGKRYDLSQMAEACRVRSDAFLQRHTRICDMLRKCPFVVDNLANMPDDNRDGWWVIDQWYEGPTLADMLNADSLSAEQVPMVMRQIAKGLEAVHSADVICRELSPEKVIYDFADNSIVLTDFEMGKLFDKNPTVRGVKWPKNKYRAPEAEGVDLREGDHHIDLYSWGRILVHAVTRNGNVKRGEEAQAMAGVDLPKKVRSVALKCVDLDRRKRPKSATAVLRSISGWK